MKVYLAKLLCPSRHCVVASVASCSDEESAQELEHLLKLQFAVMVEHGDFNPYCRICNSRELTVEVRSTDFASMDDVGTALLEWEEEQMRVRKYFRSIKN